MGREKKIRGGYMNQMDEKKNKRISEWFFFFFFPSRLNVPWKDTHLIFILQWGRKKKQERFSCHHSREFLLFFGKWNID